MSGKMEGDKNMCILWFSSSPTKSDLMAIDFKNFTIIVPKLVTIL